MNLYEITFTHYGNKDRKTGTQTLVLAENDHQIYEWLASEPKTNNGQIFNMWRHYQEFQWDERKQTYINKDDEPSGRVWYDENFNPENFKDRMIRQRGEMDDDSVDFSDVYYGITLYGWKLLGENTTTDYTELAKIGTVIDITTKEHRCSLNREMTMCGAWLRNGHTCSPCPYFK